MFYLTGSWFTNFKNILLYGWINIDVKNVATEIIFKLDY